MNIKIHRSITEIDKNRWDAVVGKGRVVFSHDYVGLMEKAGINEGRCYYPVVYDGDEIIAHTCVYLTNTELDLLAQGVIKKAINGIRRAWKSFCILRYFECGSPEAVGNPISVKEGSSRAGALRLLCQGIERLAKELDVKLLVIRDFCNEETEFHEFFKNNGYMKIHNIPKAEIKVRWKNFNDYLNSMRSSYRCKVVKGMKMCAGVDVSIHELKDFSSRYARDFKRLHDNTNKRAKEIKREALPEAFFQHLDKYLAGKAVVAVAKKDSKPIGFMLLLINDKELVSSTIGLDYDHNEEYSVYFNLFYKTIEFGIEKGFDEICLGITTMEPKKNMGSQALDLNMYMKHSNPLFNKIIPTLFDLITPPDTTGPRNVFKEK